MPLADQEVQVVAAVAAKLSHGSWRGRISPPGVDAIAASRGTVRPRSVAIVEILVFTATVGAVSRAAFEMIVGLRFRALAPPTEHECPCFFAAIRPSQLPRTHGAARTQPLQPGPSQG